MQHGGDPKRSQDPLAISQSNAAKKLGVSVESVKRAKVMQREGALETIAAVKAGQLMVKPAVKIAQSPKEKQPALVKAAGEARLCRKMPKSAAQLKADKYVREQKAAARERKEHELQLFARTLVEKFDGDMPRLLTWLDEFPNKAITRFARFGIDRNTDASAIDMTKRKRSRARWLWVADEGIALERAHVANGRR